MAILAHVRGLSMGNTCQLPVLTTEASGCAGSNRGIRRKHCLNPRLRTWIVNSAQRFSCFSAILHNSAPLCTGCAQRGNGFRLRRRPVRVQSSKYRIKLRIMKTAVEVCPLCGGSGWKAVAGAAERGVTRCDCQLRARGSALIAAARIPKRYEHCELSNFEFEGAQLDLAPARMAACRFVEEYPVNKIGLLLVGDAGLGKTHLAVGIAKALIREKGIDCVFYDYADLLKQIQDSYNPSVQTTELGLLRRVFEAEVLVLDDLGSVRPTEWRWDTVRLMLNTRYNDSRTTSPQTSRINQPPKLLTRTHRSALRNFRTRRKRSAKTL